MLSTPQIILIQTARRAAGVKDDAAWRLLLWNTARVRSSKDLDNVQFEDVLAVLEDLGFRDTKRHETFWRDKVAGRSSKVNERMARRITILAAQSRYCLPALCERFSDNRTQVVENLRPKEAWNLIEMLKQSNGREAAREKITEDLFDGIPI